MKHRIRLGINVDHVATLREARRIKYPSPVKAAILAESAGADSIVVHLREDRRHIKEQDVFILKDILQIPLNLEMSVSTNIVKFALKVSPYQATLVPERRQELTTEGGLDVITHFRKIQEVVKTLHSKGIRVSLFVDPDTKQIEIAKKTGADAIEIHTGRYADAGSDRREKKELEKIQKAALYANERGFHVFAGHGLNYHNVSSVATIPQIEELNIGHSIIGRAIFVGIFEAVREMKQIIKDSL
ncbi:MAG: pyridoxine 5'-phosphate synthase [Deltaproteobacteria bacterium]|nr:MAG: pyridoxine 5'-phosphate synthase [Deltaproteobacteria bacterium]